MNPPDVEHGRRRAGKPRGKRAARGLRIAAGAVLAGIVVAALLVALRRGPDPGHEPEEPRTSAGPQAKSTSAGTGKAPAGAAARPPGTGRVSARLEPDTTRRSTGTAQAVKTTATSQRRLEVLAGRALAPDGKPVRDARVRLEGRETVTRADGRFVIARGWGEVKIEHPDFFPRRVAADDFPVGLLPEGELKPPLERGTEDEPGFPYLDIVLRPGSRIHGKVVSAGGFPVEGARVQFGSRESSPETFTDPRGLYESPLLQHGVIAVLVNHPEWQPAMRLVVLGAPGWRVACDVRLEPGEKLVVAVRTERGDPVADAKVWLRLPARHATRARRPGAPRFAPLSAGGAPEEADHGGPVEWRYLGRTGDLGELATCRREGQRAEVRAAAPGFHEATVPVTGRKATLRLRAAPAIRGHAVDESTGLPREITSLKLLVRRGGEYEESADRGKLFGSLAKGKFLIGLPEQAGTYRVAVEAKGLRAGRSPPFVFDGKKSPPAIIVKLIRHMQLRGFLRTRAGTVPREGTVDLLEADRDGGEPRLLYGVKVPASFAVLGRSNLDDRGRFSFSDIDPGTYRLRARQHGSADYISPPLLAPWEGEYPVVLDRGLRLSGTVRGAGDVLEVDIPVVLADDAGTTRVAWTDDEGRFEFQDLAAGRKYRLAAGDPRGSGAGAAMPSPHIHTVILSAGKDGIVNIRRKTSPYGSILGRITLEGRPVPGVRLHLERLGARGEAPSAEEALTGPDGGFQWRGLSPGTYRIDGRGRLAAVTLPASRQVAVRAGRRARVELDLQGIRHGVKLVEAGTGRPYPEAVDIEWTRLGAVRSGADGETDAARVRRTVPADSGAATAVGLLAGRYALSMRARGVLLYRRAAELGGSRQDTVELPRIREVSVRLAAPSGKPFSGSVRVTVARDGVEIYSAAQEIQGRVKAPTAGPGDYRLTVRSAAGTARTLFRVHPDSSVEAAPARRTP